jgi:hypothetical protein
MSITNQSQQRTGSRCDQIMNTCHLHCATRLQILVQLQRQLEKGPLPDTMGSELLNKGGSFGNGGA